MSGQGTTRRRFLAVLAATAGSALAAGRHADGERYEWRGIALGADARLVLVGRGRSETKRVVEQCRAEVARLEAIFSLHQPESEICRLNRDGCLTAPSLDMLALLRQSLAMYEASEGLFDPTIQPLWAYYAALAPTAEVTDHEREAALAALVARVGMHHVEIGRERISLRDGAAITLNGVAQGYITDRVCEILRRHGWSCVLVDMGEVSVPGEEPFDIQVPESGLRLPLASAALATSSGALVFPGSSTVGHILLPSTGAAPRHWRAVTVRHRSATTADALSTALFLADRRRFERILRRFTGASAWRTMPDGRTERI